MKGEKPKNIAASVHSRLLTLARETKDELQLVLMRYGLERLLYRLSESDYTNEFVVKGAMLFLVWTGEPHRATKDLDLLALKSASLEHLTAVFRALAKSPASDDGLTFLPESVAAEPIRENDIYQGVRVTLDARLGKARIPLQVDVGFGDVVTPKAGRIQFPTILQLPAPMVSVYPKETAIAEKFEIMVKLGIANSRMKDYYDIWALCREFDFEGALLTRAIAATFRRRKTALPGELPVALSAEFSSDPSKRLQWGAFVKRGRLKDSEPDLAKVISLTRAFLEAPAEAARSKGHFSAHWPKGGPWKLSP
jgi:predicted nucleotidyltransferase component of viral defense system